MSAIGGPNIIEDGLVLYLDAANTKSYPGSGTTWSDISGNGNNGTLINGPTFDSGNAGNIVFDGVSDYVSFGTNSNFDFENFTVGIWAKSPTNIREVAGYPIHVINLIGKGNWNDNNSWRIGYKSSSNRPANFITFGYGIPWNSGPSLSVNSFNLSVWNYFVGVATTTQQLLYLNGFLVSTVNLSKIGVVNAFDLQIGRASYINRIFTGNISLPHIYNRPLTPQEIKQNYNATKSRFGL